MMIESTQLCIFAGYDPMRDRSVLVASWHRRRNIAAGERVFVHEWVFAPYWPLIYFNDEVGRVWPCSFMAFGYCRIWRWHLP